MNKNKIDFNWKLVVLRILVNGLAIAVTALLVPGIDLVNQSILVSLLIMGAVFGILNAIVKPIVQFLTISLIFVTYGLVVIVINTIMILLLAWLLPNQIVVSGVIVAAIGGIVMGLVSLFIESLLGMSPPIIDMEQPVAKKATGLLSKLG